MIKNKSGVSIVELLAVIVIMGILVSVSFVTISALINRTRVSADEQIVNTLNQATDLYRMAEGMPVTDIFEGLSTNNERINKLFENGYLSHLPIPSSSLISFEWVKSTQKWIISLEPLIPDLLKMTYDFSQDRLIESGFESTQGKFNDVGTHIESNFGFLFIPNPRESYSIAVSARLGTGSNSTGTSGGYGIFFDTTLNAQNKETGLVLQLDRGYADGEIIIRQRYVDDGGIVREASPLYRYPVRFVDGVFSQSGGQKDPTNPWWTQQHEVMLIVTVAETLNFNRRVDVYIDDVFLFTLFYESHITSSLIDHNLTGFRVWNSAAEFYSISIT